MGWLQKQDDMAEPMLILILLLNLECGLVLNLKSIWLRSSKDSKKQNQTIRLEYKTLLNQGSRLVKRVISLVRGCFQGSQIGIFGNEFFAHISRKYDG